MSKYLAIVVMPPSMNSPKRLSFRLNDCWMLRSVGIGNIRMIRSIKSDTTECTADVSCWSPSLQITRTIVERCDVETGSFWRQSPKFWHWPTLENESKHKRNGHNGLNSEYQPNGVVQSRFPTVRYIKISTWQFEYRSEYALTQTKAEEQDGYFDGRWGQVVSETAYPHTLYKLSTDYDCAH